MGKIRTAGLFLRKVSNARVSVSVREIGELTAVWVVLVSVPSLFVWALISGGLLVFAFARAFIIGLRRRAREND